MARSGPAAARVTIVEYSDFQCPFCGRAYATLKTQVLEENGDKVRFMFKNFPLTAIHTVGRGRRHRLPLRVPAGQRQVLAVLYDGLCSKQGEITREKFKGTVTTLAVASGLDPGQFGACLEGKATLDAVKADQAEATSLGVNSTPTFFINGRRLSGAQTYDSFKQMIEQELADKG